MKSQSQLLVIALAVSFAMVLALTVALICISYIKEAPEDHLADPPAGEETVCSTTEESVAVMVTTDAETTAELEPILPDLSNGLRFMSNGDGTCILTGIGTCTDACVVIPEYSPMGDRVIEIAPRAFYGCATVTAVQIPASVRRIGDRAFAACGNLVYLSVSLGNPFYCDVDGILYTADEGVLLQYPPMRAGNTVTIRSLTTEIADMAFYGCVYLTHVAFTGSAEQWEYLKIGSKNYSLTAAAKTFSDSGK